MNRERTHIDAKLLGQYFALSGGDAGENGSVLARACPYNVPDGRAGKWNGLVYANTVYEPGAFDAWIETHGSRRTKFMFDHGDAEIAGGNEHGVNALPIGAVSHLVSRDDGLYFEADFASSDLAQNVRELAAGGGLTDVSFASSVVRAKVESDGNRHVYEAELWDVSIVVWGQFLENAPILEVYRKELAAMEDDEEIETPSGARTCGAMVEASVYDSVTDMFGYWRQSGMITAAEFVTLSGVAGAILAAVQSAIPGDIAGRESPSPYYGYYSHRRDSEFNTNAVVEEPTIEPEPGTRDEPKAEPGMRVVSDDERRRRLAILDTYPAAHADE